jgi:metal-responsive CopG/Arc/MetJ family transcriptional regulator
MASMRTHVVLPGDLVVAIDKLVGKRGRSSFLTQAAWEQIKRQRLLKLLEAQSRSGSPRTILN